MMITNQVQFAKERNMWHEYLLLDMSTCLYMFEKFYEIVANNETFPIFKEYFVQDQDNFE